MKERSITGKVLVAMRDDERFGSCAVEIKVAKGGRMNAQQLAEHQRRALEIAWKDRLSWKIEDGGYGQKPFDGFILKKVDSYLVIWFEEKRRHEVWALNFEKIPREGSITVEYARGVGLLVNV